MVCVCRKCVWACLIQMWLCHLNHVGAAAECQISKPWQQHKAARLHKDDQNFSKQGNKTGQKQERLTWGATKLDQICRWSHSSSPVYSPWASENGSHAGIKWNMSKHSRCRNKVEYIQVFKVCLKLFVFVPASDLRGPYWHCELPAYL